MRREYYGIICSTCNAGFPLGEADPFKPVFAIGSPVLHCPTCETAVSYPALKCWAMDTPYTAEEIAFATECIRSLNYQGSSTN